MPARIVIVFLAILAIPFGVVGQSSTPKAEPTSTIPPECDKPELLAKGRPTMFTWRNGLALGISLDKQEFKAGEPIVMHIWVDNPGDTPAGVLTCGDLGRFKSYGFVLFGADGQRLLSHGESMVQSECITNPELVRARTQGCLRNIFRAVPAHTCFTRDDYDFTAVLTDNYDLPPGEYAVRPLQFSGDANDMCKLGSRTPALAKLTFLVKQP